MLLLSAGDARERGSVTAEFAILLPAVMVVLLFSLGAVELVGQQLRLQDAAFVAARTLARGEPAGQAADRVRQLVPGATEVRTDRGDLVCVTVSHAGGVGGITVPLAASGCALGDGSTDAGGGG